MSNYTEADQTAIAKIQESRVITRDAAVKLFRKNMLALANPEAENRAELILEAVQRTNGHAQSAEAVSDITKPRKMTRNERRLANKEKKAMKKTAQKEAPKRVEPVEVPELDREVELKLVGDSHPYVYTANLFGRKHAVVWSEINHDKEGAGGRFGFVSVSARRLAFAESFAKENSLPIAVCATVRVKGKLDQGYAVPLAAFEEFKLESKNALTLGSKARSAYREQGWDNCKFVEAKVEQKAA